MGCFDLNVLGFSHVCRALPPLLTAAMQGGVVVEEVALAAGFWWWKFEFERFCCCCWKLAMRDPASMHQLPGGKRWSACCCFSQSATIHPERSSWIWLRLLSSHETLYLIK
jgi:hypothetical protein